MRHVTSPYENQLVTQFDKGALITGVEDVSGKAHHIRVNASGYMVAVIASGGGSEEVTAFIESATATVAFSKNTSRGASAAGDGRGNPTTQAVLNFPLVYRRTNNDNVWMRQSGEWASATGDGEADDSPLHVSQVPKVHSEAIGGIVGTYDDNPISATSDAISLRRFTKGLVHLEFAEVTSTPTDILITLQMASAESGTYYPYVMGPWASLIHDDLTIGNGLKRCWDFDAWGEWCKITVLTSGTDINKKFGIASAMITKKV